MPGGFVFLGSICFSRSQTGPASRRRSPPVSEWSIERDRRLPNAQRFGASGLPLDGPFAKKDYNCETCGKRLRLTIRLPVFESVSI